MSAPPSTSEAWQGRDEALAQLDEWLAEAQRQATASPPPVGPASWWNRRRREAEADAFRDGLLEAIRHIRLHVAHERAQP